jgi:hypothetical protein
MQEIFKDIPNYEGLYQVSNLGNVKSLGNNSSRKERILKPQLSRAKRCQYYSLTLFSNGIPKRITIHQLVAIAFLGYAPDGTNKICVDHINNNRFDNRLENLQLITNRENSSKDRIGVSVFTGVCWHKGHKKWRAAININGKRKYLGYFDTEIRASEAYQKELNELKKINLDK